MPDQGDFSSGDVLTAADLNAFTQTTALYVSSAASYASGSDIDSEFTSAGNVIVDVGGWHSTSVNPERITPDVAGIYLVQSGCQINASGGSDFACSSTIWKNGSPIGGSLVQGNFYQAASASFILELNGSTDYVKSTVFQNSGVSKGIMRRFFSCTLLRAT